MTAVLERAFELDTIERERYIENACGADPELKRQVEALLAAHDSDATFLETAAVMLQPRMPDLTGRHLGAYRIDGPLGSGGMGDVYLAFDTKLDRQVALKLLPAHLTGDPGRLQRFRNEARAASSLNHPNILVVHDFGEDEGRPYFVTELVEGQTLRQRLSAGTLTTEELLDIAAQVASALAAAHERGVLHRDVKPENVMVRPDGYVKVLDFGLAKLVGSDERAAPPPDETREGLIMGTPNYMSPEQSRGERVDFRSDQFSFGAVLYELATGRAPFSRDSVVETAAAVISAEFVPLERAAPHVSRAVGGIIERCLAKNAADRYPATRDLHREIVAARERPPAQVPLAVRADPPRRDAIAVLPLKILRSRPDAEFLAFSLPDAIAASLAERSGLGVRSPLAAGRHGGADADLAAIADAMAAQFALTGTLTCVEDQIAVRLQLLAIPSGTVMWSNSRVATLQELFELQDAIASDVVRALPPGGSTPHVVVPRGRDTPRSAGAYGFYLRANQLAYEARHWTDARDLYRACIEADPDFAPGWARLARCERLIGKWSTTGDDRAACVARAESAFQRALALNPKLSIAHSLYAQLMIDVGRAEAAMERLLRHAAERPSDAELYAGLVHALRFCGLLDASAAAHEKTRRLDPTMPTSVHHTWWMLGDYERALSDTLGDIGYMQGLALASLGRESDAIAALRWRERETSDGVIRPYLASLRALLEDDHDSARTALDVAVALPGDAEALYYLARTFARLGDADRAVRELRRVVHGGFWCHDTFVRDPWLDSIRHRPDTAELLATTEHSAARARMTFVALDGPRLLKSASTS